MILKVISESVRVRVCLALLFSDSCTIRPLGSGKYEIIYIYKQFVENNCVRKRKFNLLYNFHNFIDDNILVCTESRTFENNDQVNCRDERIG